MDAITNKTRRLLAGVLIVGLPGVGAAGPSIQFGEEGYISLNYAVQMWLQQQDFTSANDSGDQTDFFLRRNRLTFTGQYNDYLGFYAQLEAGSDSKDGNDDREVFYRDAYVTLDYSDTLRVIAGRFKNTFSRENLEACLEPLTLDRSDISFTPFAGSRDTGVALWGNLADGALQYRLMAADGREGDEVAKDSPRLTARLHWSPLDPEYDYGYRGTYLGTQTVFTIGVAYDTQADVAYADAAMQQDAQDYEATTADMFFEYPTSAGTFTASAAIFDYSVGDAINGNPDGALPQNTELDGYYAKVGYLLPNKVGAGRLQFFARYDEAEYNLNSGLLDNTRTGAGFNYYLDGQKLKFTGEYMTVDFDRDHPTNVSLRDYDQFTLGFQMIF
ncbi:MAG: OprO/OprP family phosphate-selective porin [Gammaproteobacteria bacterium]|nr:OprO/OprP family phosphate-selective porin [Gammaproteobacteria bacterium]